MKRLLIAFILVLPVLRLGAQTLAQSYSMDADQLIPQFYQEGRKEMSKEEEEKLLNKLSKEMRSKLEEIKKLNKEKYQQMLRSSYHSEMFSAGFANAEEVFGLKGFSELYKREKELEVDSELLALKCKNADEAAQQKLKNELSTKLSELFDIKEGKKQEELRKLEKRIQELKESLQARKQNKQDIVNRRIQEMVGDAKYLRWE